MTKASDRVERAIRRLQPRYATLFREAINAVRDQATLKALAQRLEAGDLDGALRLVGTDPMVRHLQGAGNGDSFKAVTFAGLASGAAVARENLPNSISTRIRFDMVNPRAVAFIDQYDARLIREVTDATRKGVLAVVRSGQLEGLAPVKQARIIRETVGLTEKQALAVTNFRRQLEQRTNTPDGQSMQAAASRRLSATERSRVARHIREGGLSQSQINQMVEQYRGRLVNLRANTIARTETARAVSQGQLELWKQARDQGLLPVDVKRKWIVTRDDRLRETHRAVPGMNEGGVDLDQPFQTPLGPVMVPPLEVNCRCTVVLALNQSE